MKVRFLKNLEVPTKITECCGDGCCSWDEWKPGYVIKDEESEATVERTPFYQHGTVDVSGLKFNEDYIIIEFP